MDQVKEILGMLRRQHFWFVAPILLAVGAAGWWMARKQLSDEFEANKSKVQSYISQMQTVSGQQNHPNPQFHEGMDQLIEARRANVKAAWEKKWERQKQELKWPEDLTDEFIKIVEPMRPIERVDVDTRPIPSNWRRSYQGFIKNMLPRLAERIGAKWEPANLGGARGFGDNDFRAESRSGNGGDDVDAAETEVALVDWDPQNQGEIEQRFDWGSSAPNTFEVLYAQEDLWVLTDLIDIIKRTNGDAVVRAQAPIKAIDFIQIGKDVTAPAKTGFRVVRPQATGDDEGLGDDLDEPASEEIEFGPDSMDTTGGLTAPGTAPSSTAIKMELVKDRYYNKDYEPIADLATLLSSVTVAKRIPVRMRLQMDQRHITKLLVECANAPLTFEVRQIRFNPTDPTGLGGGYNERGATEGFYNTQQAVKTLDDYETLVRTVELFGIIYIFNPVDEVILDGQTPEVEIEAETALSLPVDRRRFARLVALR